MQAKRPHECSEEVDQDFIHFIREIAEVGLGYSYIDRLRILILITGYMIFEG